MGFQKLIFKTSSSHMRNSQKYFVISKMTPEFKPQVEHKGL